MLPNIPFLRPWGVGEGDILCQVEGFLFSTRALGKRIPPPPHMLDESYRIIIKYSVLLVFTHKKNLLTDKRERKHYPLAEVIIVASTETKN